MQEEITQGAVSLSVEAGKMTADLVVSPDGMGMGPGGLPASH